MLCYSGQQTRPLCALIAVTTSTSKTRGYGEGRKLSDRKRLSPKINWDPSLLFFPACLAHTEKTFHLLFHRLTCAATPHHTTPHHSPKKGTRPRRRFEVGEVRTFGPIARPANQHSSFANFGLGRPRHFRSGRHCRSPGQDTGMEYLILVS